MKKLIYLSLFFAFIGVLSCTRSARKPMSKNESVTTKYENELFSVMVPYSWVCDSSNWNGLDVMTNEVDIYDPKPNIVRFHFVKTFMPFKWKDITEAKEFAKAARGISGDDVELIDEIDSVEVGGYPACILYFANYLDNDTIIQKQFVTYLMDSHIVAYFNEFFPIQYSEEAEEFGDLVISSIRLKSVKNPLDDNKVLKKALEDGMNNDVVDDKYLKRSRDLIQKYGLPTE